MDRKGRCIFTIARDRIANHAEVNDNAKPSKPCRKPPVVKPARPRPPVPCPDDTPPPMNIPAFSMQVANDTKAVALPFLSSNATPTIVGDATLYQADCLSAIRAMPSESVDVIFTSPPYNLGEQRASGGRGKNMLLNNGYETFGDDMPREAYVAWQKEVLRVLAAAEVQRCHLL